MLAKHRRIDGPGDEQYAGRAGGEDFLADIGVIHRFDRGYRQGRRDFAAQTGERAGKAAGPVLAILAVVQVVYQRHLADAAAKSKAGLLLGRRHDRRDQAEEIIIDAGELGGAHGRAEHRHLPTAHQRRGSQSGRADHVADDRHHARIQEFAVDFQRRLHIGFIVPNQ